MQRYELNHSHTGCCTKRHELARRHMFPEIDHEASAARFYAHRTRLERRSNRRKRPFDAQRETSLRRSERDRGCLREDRIG